jgi:hypothetical protein
MNTSIGLCILCVAAFWDPGAAGAATWTAQVDPHDGLPSLSKGGQDALSSSFAFWGKNWAWADQRTEFHIAGPLDYSIAGTNSALNLDLKARIHRASDRQLVWDFDLDAHSASSGVIGGGIAFKFDLGDFGAALGEPELLADNRGWAWGRAGGSRFELRFDPPLASVYFEAGQKSEIRAFFYHDSIPEGRRHYVATLSVSGDAALGVSEQERFGPVDYGAWHAGILDPNLSPVDLSFLNAVQAPAGKHGFVQAHEGRLVFGDGAEIRFWGADLTAYALFGTPKEYVKKQAHRLSQLGFNLIRIHHHDSEWVDPNIFGDAKVANTQALNEEMLERLDWWIKCLKDEGIYVWLDLEVGRRFKPGDGIENFREISKGKPSAALEGYNFVDPGIQEAMKRFDEQYLDHQNRFTGLRYKEDPAIVAVLISNENDLTHHFGNELLADKNVPHENALYMREARAFAGKYSLPEDKVWRSWEDGPSKLFLNDLEHRFDVEMITHLRALGEKALIVPTSTWGGNPLSSLPALTTGDMIDVHSYGGSGTLEINPIYGPNLAHWIAAAHILGKPLSVTEWGLDDRGSLAKDREDVPLFIAASAAMQGWNALMFFAYSQEAFGDGSGKPSIYQAYNDPALMAAFPAAALLYRQGHVQEASTRYVFAPSPALLFDHDLSPATSVALRTAAERGKLSIALPQVAQLPWLDKSQVPAGSKIITDPQESQIPIDALEVVSDTGELRRNWSEGVFTIDTPRTEAAMGWVGGKTITLGKVEIAIATRNAVVAVQSLDGNPIGESRAIMISVGARSELKDNSMPFYSEPLRGTVTVAAPAGLTLQASDTHSGKMSGLPTSYRDGRYVISLDGLKTSWLKLEAPRAASTPRSKPS